jgi:carbonic anhydrase
MGSDVHLQFERGLERKQVEWLRQWIDAYVEPEAVKQEMREAELAKFQVKEAEKNAREQLEALIKSVPVDLPEEKVLEIRRIVEGDLGIKAAEAPEQTKLPL